MTSFENDRDRREPGSGSFRLIAFSVVILAGAIGMGLGSIAERRGNEVAGTGGTLVFVGGLLFFGELYLSGFFQDLWHAITQQGERQRRPEADDPPPPPPTD